MLKMTTITELWSSFKDLSWWRKVLLFLPFIVLGIIMAIWAFSDNYIPTSIKPLIKDLEKDKKELDKTFKENDKEIEKINKEIEENEKNQQKYYDEHSSEIERINNANANELINIAKEFRGDTTSTTTDGDS